MKFRVTTTTRVDREISRIALWYQERSGSEQVADNWLLRFRSAMQILERNPDRHPLAREADDFDFEVREILFGSGRRKTHRILFQIDDEKSVVRVVGIRHFAQRDFTTDDL